MDASPRSRGEGDFRFVNREINNDPRVARKAGGVACDNSISIFDESVLSWARNHSGVRQYFLRSSSGVPELEQSTFSSVSGRMWERNKQSR